MPFSQTRLSDAHGMHEARKRNAAARQQAMQEKMVQAYNIIAEKNPEIASIYTDLLPTIAANGPRGEVVPVYNKSLESFMKTLGHHIGDVGTLANQVRILNLEWINLKMDPDRRYALLSLFPIIDLDPNTLSLKIMKSYVTNPEFTPATEGTLPRIGGVQYSESESYARRVHLALQTDLTALMTTLGAKENVAHASLVSDAAARLLERRIYAGLMEAANVCWSMITSSANPRSNYMMRTRFFAMVNRGLMCMTAGLSEALRCLKRACPASQFDTVICRSGLLSELELEPGVVERRFRDDAGGAESQLKRLSGFNLDVLTHDGILDANDNDITLGLRNVMEFYPMEGENISICDFSSGGSFVTVEYSVACENSECFLPSVGLPTVVPESPEDFDQDDPFRSEYRPTVFKQNESQIWFALSRDSSRQACTLGEWGACCKKTTVDLIRSCYDRVRKQLGQAFNPNQPLTGAGLSILWSLVLDNNSVDSQWSVALRNRAEFITANFGTFSSPVTVRGRILKEFVSQTAAALQIAAIIVSLPICPTVLCSLAYNGLPSPFTILLVRPQIEFTTENMLLVKRGGDTAELGINYPLIMLGDDPQVNERYAIISFYEAFAVIKAMNVAIIPDVAINEYIAGGGTEFITERGDGSWTGDMLSYIVPVTTGRPQDKWSNFSSLSDRTPDHIKKWVVWQIGNRMKEIDPEIDIGDEAGYYFSVDRGFYIKEDGSHVRSSGLLGYIGNEATGNEKRAQMTSMPKGTTGYRDFS